jgi:SAM-dependent methyltransferase
VSNRGLSFGRVAGLYDALRPTYPDEMFDAIVAFGGLVAGDAALEIGAGTGKATLSMLARGLRVDAIEPDAEMAGVLRDKGVTVEATTFEAWPLRAGAYRLLYAAQAWHWVESADRYEKAAAALAPGGTIALFWNTPREFEGALGTEVDAIYARIAPETQKWKPNRWGLDVTLDQLVAAPGFVDEQKQSIEWAREYSRADYVALNRTTSVHLMLDEPRREQILREVGEVIDAHGGTVTCTYDTQVYMARSPERR